MAEFLEKWIVTTMDSLGYWGIGLLMFLENIFPPIPSELIMPLAGYTAGLPNTKIQLIPAIVAGVVGTILGALPWYYAGKLVGETRLKNLADKYGKWAGISSNDFDKVQRWFVKQGEKAVLIGRLVPGIRTLISLPAGVSNMPIVPFLIYSTIGTTLWVALLTYTGYVLGANYTVVKKFIDPIEKIVLVAIVVVPLIWIVMKIQKSKSKKQN